LQNGNVAVWLRNAMQESRHSRRPSDLSTATPYLVGRFIMTIHIR
jgi:hypothetical protein